ncbi:hypothetical protein BH23ACT3_BH23ACT3_12520 [soil metagenome]
MSGAETSQGPGWWQASDGKWYPPEQKPGAAPSAPPSPNPTPNHSNPTPNPAPSSTQAGSGMPAAQPVPGADSGEGSFFARLFDMSFSRFVTPSLIKILFILSIIVVTIYALVLLIAGAANAGGGGIFLVIVAPIAWLLGVIYARVLLELAIVFFRIEINTRPKA